MTFMPIQPPPGIVRGANPDDAPGRWYDGSLIRWREGVMEPVVTGASVREFTQWESGLPFDWKGIAAPCIACMAVLVLHSLI